VVGKEFMNEVIVAILSTGVYIYIYIYIYIPVHGKMEDGITHRQSHVLIQRTLPKESSLPTPNMLPAYHSLQFKEADPLNTFFLYSLHRISHLPTSKTVNIVFVANDQ